MIKIKLPKEFKISNNYYKNTDLPNNNKQLRKYFKKIELEKIIYPESQKKIDLKDNRKSNHPHIPDLYDLYILYELIRLNNRISILEYGCGWSTLVMHKALIDNKKDNQSKKYKRVSKPYQLNVVDASKKFIKICYDRIKKYSKDHKLVKMNYSKAIMTSFNGRYCTEYQKHPLINPDFIYIDGPSQWHVDGKINGFTVNNFEMMPMLSDVLKYEHFLNPGTIILMDGRGANCRFLKKNFQRNWIYHYIRTSDQHVFYLNEKPLGKWNLQQINFFNKKNLKSL
tara:strand:- start:93 stop:941 length:849 start_codon:yes stop_codon:yes gene_type:complete